MTRDAFLPYSRQKVTDADVEKVVEALTSSIISQGPLLVEFESAFAATAGASFAVGFSSGTAALHGMCVAAGIKPGDEVIVPAMTFAATANAVLYAGGKPVFVDIDPVTVCLDPECVEAAVTQRTRAIIAVDFAGHPADYVALRQIADRHGLLLLSDGAHAPGGQVGDSLTSQYADLVAYSFNPVKNITSAEGGMTVTDDEQYAGTLTQFRTHGMTRDPDRLQNEPHGDWYFEQQFLGYNYKLSELHAALGLSQLSRLSAHTEARRHLATIYDDGLVRLPIERPSPRDDVRPTWHLYVIRVDKSIRKALFDFLRDRRLGVQVHYLPVPMHPYYASLGYDMAGLDNSVAYYESAISLPLHQSMTETDVDRVVTAVSAFFR